MKDKIRDISKKTIVLFAAAVLVFSMGGIMAAKAALEVTSPTYDAELEVASVMDLTILEGEGDKAVDAGASKAVLNALKDSDGESVSAVPGKRYDETLAVKNNSDRPMYVRMIVRKYWKDQEGVKGTYLEEPLDPKYIKLAYQGSSYNSDDWIRNENESTKERDVYYCKSIVTDTTAPLFDSVHVDRAIVDEYTTDTSEEKGGKTIITYTYQYDGCSVCLEVEAQAVQTHNAVEAIKSIWGVDASLSGGSIESIK